MILNSMHVYCHYSTRNIFGRGCDQPHDWHNKNYF